MNKKNLPEPDHDLVRFQFSIPRSWGWIFLGILLGNLNEAGYVLATTAHEHAAQAHDRAAALHERAAATASAIPPEHLQRAAEHRQAAARGRTSPTPTDNL